MNFPELAEKNDGDLNKIAEHYGVDTRLKKETKIEEIEKAFIRKKLEMEAEARAKLSDEAKAKLGILKDKPRKPSPETVAIENSKKVYVVFHNKDCDEADIKFAKGEKYKFHLFPGRLHVLPDFLVRDLKARCRSASFTRKEDPKTHEVRSVRTGSVARYIFEVLGDAPEKSEFGVVLDNSNVDQSILDQIMVSDTQ